MIFFFGGGWRNGDLEQFRPQCDYFAALGLVTIRAEYRVSSRHGTTPFDAMADARDCVRYVRSHSEELNIAPDRIAAAGGSAGGHIAACCAFFPDEPTCVPNALVLFNPVLDTTETGFGHERFGGRSKEASPLHHIRSGLPPTMIVHGTADNAVAIDTVRAFATQMHKASNRCDLHEFSGAGHGFFNPKPGADADYLSTLKLAEEFLRNLRFFI